MGTEPDSELPSEIPAKIQHAAKRLREGHRVNRITVRDFLRHFGVERRGAGKIEAIRGILDSLDLQTEPDFETVWIGEPIWLRLKDSVSTEDIAAAPIGEVGDDEFVVLEGTPSAVEQAVEQSKSAPTSAERETPSENADLETSDPTFRIGSLPAPTKVSSL
jgi:hypothetical protein